MTNICPNAMIRELTNVKQQTERLTLDHLVESDSTITQDHELISRLDLNMKLVFLSLYIVNACASILMKFSKDLDKSSLRHTGAHPGSALGFTVPRLAPSYPPY